MFDDDYYVPELMQRLFEQTGDPLMAWSGYRWYSQHMRHRPLPTWICDYFDRVFAGIETLWEADVDPTGEQIRAVAVEALGLKRSGQGVRTDAFTQRRNISRDLELAQQVMLAKLKSPKRSYLMICEDVSEANGFLPGSEIVQRAWDAFGRFVRAEHIKQQTT